MGKGNYKKLFGMILISFVVMYGVMFFNVAAVDHVYLSLTRLYMSLLMVTPMAVLMVLMMPKMYPARGLNVFILSFSSAVFLLSLFLLRTQTFVSDEQYMRAMIPHHSSAIMTSKHADIKDPEVRKLADSVIESQEREINQMKMILNRLDE